MAIESPAWIVMRWMAESAMLLRRSESGQEIELF